MISLGLLLLALAVAMYAGAIAVEDRVQWNDDRLVAIIGGTGLLGGLLLVVGVAAAGVPT